MQEGSVATFFAIAFSYLSIEICSIELVPELKMQGQGQRQLICPNFFHLGTETGRQVDMAYSRERNGDRREEKGEDRSINTNSSICPSSSPPPPEFRGKYKVEAVCVCILYIVATVSSSFGAKINTCSC